MNIIKLSILFCILTACSGLPQTAFEKRRHCVSHFLERTGLTVHDTKYICEYIYFNKILK